MRRFVVAGLVALAAGSGAVALATADAPRARLTSYLCQTALDPAERAISVTAVMRPVQGTGKMAMRFQLIKRTHRYSRPMALTGTDLNSWLTPKNPTLGSRPGDRWVVKHPVVDLAGPDFYRFKVAFRWSDASGHVIGRALRSSPLCFQPERRPDLEIVNITVTALAGGLDEYFAQIRNAGKTAAGSFQVQFSDGVSADTMTKTLPPLPAHHQRAVHFKAPACSAAAPATITADPGHLIDVSSRAESAMTTTCAGATQARARSVGR
jgi:hypothetical protein